MAGAVSFDDSPPSSELEARELAARDKFAMMKLCKECFPVEYPEVWYDRLVSGDQGIHTRGVFEKSTGLLVGMIASQIHPLRAVEREYGAIVETADRDDTVMYVNIFGVVERWRRKGLGSYLMDHLTDYVDRHTNCKVIYLHVEVENQSAISFYTYKNFSRFCRVPGYYTIKGEPVDSFLYMKCCHGSQPYTGHFKSWCRRYVMDSSVCHCFSDWVQDMGNTVKSMWKKDKEKD